jgi:hypothetical protein
VTSDPLAPLNERLIDDEVSPVGLPFGVLKQDAEFMREHSVRKAYERKCKALGLVGTGVKLSRVRGCVVLATPQPFDGVRICETKHYPPGTEGAREYPHGVRYVRATVPLDWRPAWREQPTIKVESDIAMARTRFRFKGDY